LAGLFVHRLCLCDGQEFAMVQITSEAGELAEYKSADPVVLVVDDDPVIVQTLGQCLGAVARVRFAMRGDAALKQMKDARPSLVLLDARMPGLSGFDVLDAMRGDPELAQIPVIMITGDDGEQQEQLGLEKGAVDFIAKPLHPGVVVARVRTQLRLAKASADLKAVSAMDRLNLVAALVQLRVGHADLQRTADELAEANQSLLQFVRIASHDLREPLNTIDQFSGLLEEDFGTQLPASGKKYLTLVRRAASRMRTLLNDVVNYARLEVGSSEKLEPVPLNALLEELRDALASRIAETRAVVSVGPLPTVAGQRSLLSLVFQNLLANSLKFMPKDREPRIEVSAKEADKQWIISFQDNGIGIPAADQAKVFDPFVRLHRKQEFDGTGLGLAITRRIIEAHGGLMRLNSDPERQPGTEFQVILPAA
jgi:two-component system, sensor histidine kinase and response regulator